MIIEPVPTNFRTVASSTFVEIPQFQRPYSWTTENIEEFWDDLIAVKGLDYFVGTVVMFKNAKDPQSLYITDGQQRFTTLTILLCVIRDMCREAGLEGLANGIQNIIERKDIDDKERFFLKYGSSNKFLAKKILSKDSQNDNTKAVTDEEKAQKRAYSLLNSKLTTYLTTNHGDNWKGVESSKNDLISIRNTILGVQFITLTLGNEDDAYTVFETLNSRGKDLEVSDLLKNLFTKLLKTKNKDLTPVSDAWVSMRGRFEGLSSKVSFDAFLLHFWLATEKNVSRKNLFKEMKNTIQKPKAKAWLSTIESSSETYAKIASPNDYLWAKEERGIHSALDAVNKFGVAQARPLLLAVLGHYFESDFVKLKQVKKTIQYIERFTFQFNAITQSRGGGGISGMYSNLARSCTSITTPEEYAEFNKEVLERFRGRDINREEFIVSFKQLHYSNEYPKDRVLVRYILKRFHESQTKLSSLDYSAFSIEHLNPQSGNLANDVFGNIGNLAFLPETLNEKLDNKPFAKKKNLIIDEGHGDGIFNNWSNASSDEIDNRATLLAEIAFDKIWKL